MSDKALVTAEVDGRICFNYIDFLSASCKKRWSFVDAIYGVLPIFGMVTRKPAHAPEANSDRLKELALQIISTQVSDEINIARLVTLAEQQAIAQFDILLPYALSEKQLEAIQQEYGKPLDLQQQGERLTLSIPAVAH